MGSRGRLRVDLIEDDAAVLNSLGLYLESKGFEVRQFSSASAFMRTGLTGEPADCIVSDVRMPGLSGLELQKALAKSGVPTQLILITAFADVETAVTAMKAGAFDFIEKPVNEQRLVSSIRKAASKSGELYAKASELAELRSRLAALTEREREVMELATTGYTNREIAGKLGISQRTVEIHRSNIMLKTKADSLADLVRIVLQLKQDA